MPGPGGTAEREDTLVAEVGAGALALVVAGSSGWSNAYMACALFALPAMLTALMARLDTPAAVLHSLRQESSHQARLPRATVLCE